MSEATLKLRTQADLDDLRKWIKGMGEAKQAAADLQAAVAGIGGAGGGSHANVSSGAPPPSPAARPGTATVPGGASSASSGAPPPPPVQTATGPAPATPGVMASPSPMAMTPGVTPTIAGISQLAAPPPAPAPLAFTPGMMQMAAHMAAMPAADRAGAASPPPPAASLGGGAGAPSGSGGGFFGGAGGAGGGSGGRGAQGQSRVQRGLASGKRFLGTAAATAVGLGLGSSMSGFFLQSGQKYMELSRILGHTAEKFREADKNAATFGGTLGFTIGQTAQYAESLGKQTNKFDSNQFQNFGGFSRYMGMDPGTAMTQLGTSGRLAGRDMSNRDLAQMAGAASMQGMGQGRFEEQLAAQNQLMLSSLKETGSASPQTAMGLQATAGRIFGGGELGKGSMGADFMGRLSGVVSGQGSPAMKSYMMRAMGYGREEGPGYIEMRERLEAGVNDPENLKDLFGSFQERGLGEGGMFRALESVAGGKLKAHEIKSLVGSLGTKEGLARYTADMDGVQGAESEFQKGLSDSQRETFGKLGMFGLGKETVTMGESRNVQLENMQMKVGRHVATVMADMGSTLENIAGGLGSLIGMDLGTMLTDLSGAIKDLSSTARTVAGIAGGNGYTVSAGVNKLASRTVGSYATTLAATNVGGAKSGLAFVAGANISNMSLGFIDPVASGLVTDPVAAQALQMSGHAGGGDE